YEDERGQGGGRHGGGQLPRRRLEHGPEVPGGIREGAEDTLKSRRRDRSVRAEPLLADGREHVRAHDDQGAGHGRRRVQGRDERQQDTAGADETDGPADEYAHDERERAEE